MRVLVLNAGSSSLKYGLLEMPVESVLARGLVERIGQRGVRAHAKHRDARGNATEVDVDCTDHTEALDHVLSRLASYAPHGDVDYADHDVAAEHAVARLAQPAGCSGAALEGVAVVGHRVVHGGELFTAPARLDRDALARLERLVALAPLHLPPALACVEHCMARLPAAAHVGVFDTTFHQSMPDYAYLYPVPPEWYRRYGVRRYGFHGTSHQHAVQEVACMLGRRPEELRIVTAHLGNGASLAAWDRGRVLDTSMGLTPLEGVMMGTRAGDIDPAIVTHVAARAGIPSEQVIDQLNRRSGLAGVSGRGRDMREVIAARAQGDPRARLAFDMFVHRLRKYLGAYVFALGGADAVALTGGIGENAVEVREALFAGLEGLGLVLDTEANRGMPRGGANRALVQDGSADAAARSGPGAGGPPQALPHGPERISAPRSRTAIFVVPADEELLIGREAYDLCSAAPTPNRDRQRGRPIANALEPGR